MHLAIAMKTRITNAKIACLDINLQKARMQLGVQILVDDPSQLEDIRRRYDTKAMIFLATYLLRIIESSRLLSSGFVKYWQQEPTSC